MLARLAVIILLLVLNGYFVAVEFALVRSRRTRLMAMVRAGAPIPDGRALDAIARGVIEADGRWPAYGHGLGHGIGLEVHELPSLGRRAKEEPIASPTVTITSTSLR